MRSHLSAMTAILILALVQGNLAADLINGAPSDLLPGDDYRLVFVSSTRHRVNHRDLSVYDSILDPLGDLIISSDWMVLGASTITPDARIRTGTETSAEIPIYRTDGLRVADGYDDFWDQTLDRPIQYDENGTDVGGAHVWTGMGASGQYVGDGLGDPFVRSGRTDRTDSKWALNGFDLNGSRNRLFAISGVLTVRAIPEPSALISIGVVYLTLLVSHRNRSSLSSAV